MLERFQSVVFDFDGTLVPNLDLVGMKQRLRRFTLLQGVPEGRLENLYIVELIESATGWLEDQNPEHASRYNREAHQLIRDIELESAIATRLFPGMRESLDVLKDQGISIGIVTRNCEEAVKLMFPEVHDYCEAFLAREHVTHLKPDPRHVEVALNQLGCSGPQCVMVGDGEMDMSVGRHLGMYCVGVLSGSCDREQLIAAGAELVLDKATELVA